MATKLIVLLSVVFTIGSTVTKEQTNSTLSASALTEAQTKALAQIRADSEKKAAPVALRLASISKQVYDNMLSDREDEQRRRRLARKINKSMLELERIKGQAIREMIAVLSPAQKKTS